MDEGQDTSCVCTCVCARESRDELASLRQEKNRRKALRGAASGCGGGDNKEVCLFLFFAPSFSYTAGGGGYFYRPGTHGTEKEQIHL